MDAFDLEGGARFPTVYLHEGLDAREGGRNKQGRPQEAQVRSLDRAPQEREVVLHPRVDSDLDRLPQKAQDTFHERVEMLRRGDRHSSTHPLNGPLKGWSGTSIGGTQHRMVHRYQGNELQIVSVGNHDEAYDQGLRRAIANEDHPYKEEWKPGETAHYEYHCLESPESSDAHLWARSHQPVTVMHRHPSEPGYEDSTRAERASEGAPHVYRVKFGDGHEGDAWEDELMTHPKHWFRPDPPAHIRTTAAYNNLEFRDGIDHDLMDDPRIEAHHPEHGMVGHLTYRVSPPKPAWGLPNGAVSVQQLTVHPDHQRNGVASQLLHELEKKRFPTVPVEHGQKTEDGKAFSRATMGDDSDNRWTLNGERIDPPKHFAKIAIQDPGELRFEHSERESGGSKWPTHHTLTAYSGDEQAGHLRYYTGPRRKTILIDGLETDPQHQRKGVGSALMDEMQRQHPDASINHGDRTDDGKAWWAGYTKDKKVQRGRTILGHFSPKYRVFTHTCGLDHRLWDSDQKLKPEVRQYILQSINVMWAGRFSGWAHWARVYFAGSEASEWTSDILEGNNDFDVLIGVDYQHLRDARPEFRGMSNQEITDEMNAGFKAYNGPVMLTIDGVQYGPFDRTTFVDVASDPDIRKIKPYAAYDVGKNEWVVKPPHLPHWGLDKLDPAVQKVLRSTDTLARNTLKLPEPERTQQGAALFDAWHSDRSRAFSPNGEGWYDIANLREKWLDQAGLWSQLVDCKHKFDQGLGAAPADWSNTPKTAGANGPDYTNLRFKYWKNYSEPSDHPHWLDGNDKHDRRSFFGLMAFHPDHPHSVGTLEFSPHDYGDGDREVTLHGLKVNPEHQRRGVGKALMGEVMRRYHDVPINHGIKTEQGEAFTRGTQGIESPKIDNPGHSQTYGEAPFKEHWTLGGKPYDPQTKQVKEGKIHIAAPWFDTGEIKRPRPKSVRRAGFAGFVADSDWHREFRDTDNEADKPDHLDDHLGHFVRHHSEHWSTWDGNGEHKQIDLKQPIYATQSHVSQHHIDRYRKNPNAVSWAMHDDPDPIHTDDYPGHYSALMVTHQGRLHAIEGHHRVAAKIQDGHESMGAWHYDLDKHPIVHNANGDPCPTCARHEAESHAEA